MPQSGLAGCLACWQPGARQQGRRHSPGRWPPPQATGSPGLLRSPGAWDFNQRGRPAAVGPPEATTSQAQSSLPRLTALQGACSLGQSLAPGPSSVA